MSSVAQRRQQTGIEPARRQRQRGRARRSFGQKVKTFFGVVFTLVLLTALVGIGYTYLLLKSTVQGLPDTNALADYLPGGPTEIFATDKDPKTGKNVLLGRVQSEYKEFAPITDIPAAMQKATVAVEDERFYSHRGVDLRGIGRALYRDVRGGRMGEGGSTLTQQLARNANLGLNKKKNLKRKIQEAILAIQLEKNYSKQQILEMYLNEVCYGVNTFGVKAASQMYFGKKPKEMTLGECALLAGIPQQPSRLNPFEHLDAALDRRDVVLSQMLSQNQIDAAQYKLAKSEKVHLIPPRVHKQDEEFKAPYFTNYVLRQLNAKYGKDAVQHGGLKVYTTLNYQMQQEAERAILNGIENGRGDGVTQGAIISLEPRTGFIRAMVGGRDFKENQYNNVTQGRRQPGSSFKVFVYTAAFMSNPKKYNPDYEVNDAPVTFGKGRSVYRPKNYDGRFHGEVSIRTALTHSYNIPAVKVANEVGIKRVIQTAQALGIDSPLTPDLSLALGSRAVTPLELCSAYSTFANHGSHAEPMAIIRILDGTGKVIEQASPEVDQSVVPESIAGQISSMLSDVVEHGTAASAAGIHEVEDAHGKTGTTNDNRDAWFVGYTPELTTAVWVCGVKTKVNKGKKVPVYVPMEGVTGGHICAPIWARFMKAAVPIQRQAGLPELKAPEKDGAKDAAVAAALKAQSGKKTPDDEPTPEASPEPRRHRKRHYDDTEAAPATPTPEATPADTSDNKGKGETDKGDGSRDNPNAGPVPTPTPAEAPTPRPTTRRRIREAGTAGDGEAAANSEGGTVTVAVCEETGMRATKWCPVTVEKTFRRGEAPHRSCSRHKPQPGDG